MRFVFKLAGLGLVAALGANILPASAAPASARSKACFQDSDKNKLHGKARTAFHTKCMEGALHPATPNTADPKSLSEQVITAPSGTDRTQRSKQCSAEADRRGLPGPKRDGFRLSCMATAAPVEAVGSRQAQTKPTAAKPGLDALTAAPPQGSGASSAGALTKPK